MLDLGFAGDRRSFAPHLTLGFVRDGADKAAIASVVSTINDATEVPHGGLHVEQVILFASDPGPSGSVYTAVEQFPLA